MATNYTANYGLCQWEPGDNFLREEFNQDNAKIDATLLGLNSGKISRSELIFSTVTTQTSNDVICDLSELDWNEWEMVFLIFDRGYSSGSNEKGTFELDWNNGSITGYCGGSSLHFLSITANPFLLTLFPRHDATRTIRGQCSGPTGLCVAKAAYQDITSLRIHHSLSGTVMGSGATLEIWGIK